MSCKLIDENREPTNGNAPMTKPKGPAPRKAHEDLRIRDASPQTLAQAVMRDGDPKRQDAKPKR